MTGHMIVTWQFAYKRAWFLAFRQFAFLWTEDSFSGLPCLELVIRWSKIGSCLAVGVTVKVKTMGLCSCKTPDEGAARP